MQTQSKAKNGLNLEQLTKTVEVLKAKPSLAQFEFRAKNAWVTGGHNRSTIQGFHGVGAEDDSRAEPFEYDNGEPPVLLGRNEGANPVEYLLHALAGCVTTTFILHATARGIAVREVETELKGSIDVQGLLDLSSEVPVGYAGIDVGMRVVADAPDEEIEDLIRFAQAHSPVLNTISNPVSVKLQRA